MRDDDWDTVRSWAPGRLDDDLRDGSAEAIDGLQLFERWLVDHDKQNQFRFCWEWRSTRADAGPSDDRDTWYDELAATTRFPVALVRVSDRDSPDTDAPSHLSDDAGNGLCRVTLDGLRRDYDLFDDEVAGWRQELADMGWDLGGQTASGLPPVSLRLWVMSPGDARHEVIDFGSLDEFARAFRKANMSAWFDVDQALDAAVAGGHPQIPDRAGVTGYLAYDPSAQFVEMVLTLQTTPPGTNTTALQALRKGGDVCYYRQHNDIVVCSTDHTFPGVDPMKLALMTPTNHPTAPFTPAGDTDTVGQIVRRYRLGRNRDYFTVHPPGKYTSGNSDYVQAAIETAHPGRQVQIVR